MSYEKNKTKDSETKISSLIREGTASTTNVTHSKSLLDKQTALEMQESYEPVYNKTMLKEVELSTTNITRDEDNLKYNSDSKSAKFAIECTFGRQEVLKITDKEKEFEIDEKAISCNKMKGDEMSEEKGTAEKDFFLNEKMNKIDQLGTIEQVIDDKKLSEQDTFEAISQQSKGDVEEVLQIKNEVENDINVEIFTNKSTSVHMPTIPKSGSSLSNQCEIANHDISLVSEIMQSQDTELIIGPVEDEETINSNFSPKRENSPEVEHEVVCLDFKNKYKGKQPNFSVFEEIIDVDSFENECRFVADGQHGWSSDKPIDVDTLSPIVESANKKRKKIDYNSENDCEITGSTITMNNGFQLKLDKTDTLPNGNVDDEDPSVVIDKLFRKLSCPVCLRNFRRPLQASSVSHEVENSSLSEGSIFYFSKPSSSYPLISSSEKFSDGVLFNSSSLQLSPLLASKLQFDSSFSVSSQALVSSAVSSSPSLPASTQLSSHTSPDTNLLSSFQSVDGFASHTSLFASLSFNSAYFSNSNFSLHPFLSDARTSFVSSCQFSNPSKAADEVDNVPRLIKKKGDTEKKIFEDNSKANSLAVTRCGHVFCKTCIIEALKIKKQCPLCRKNLKTNQWYPLYL